MFDRFKFNRKTAANTIECPLCQEKNPEGSDVCSRCSYQLTLASHQQAGNVNEEETSELFDELLSDFEEDEEEEVVDWSRTTFTMDDVTIDVKQYGKDDSVVTKQKPSFAMTVDTPEPIVEEAEEEEYELTPDDDSQVHIMANTYNNNDYPDFAIRVYQAGIRAMPDNAFFDRSLGRLLEQSGRLEEALAAYRSAAAKDADSNFYGDLVENLERRLDRQ